MPFSADFNKWYDANYENGDDDHRRTAWAGWQAAKNQHSAEHMKTASVYNANEDGAGMQTWRLNGQLHREDGPAVIWANGIQEWCRNGLRHREDGPAFIWADGHQEWYQNGVLHRADGPAVIYINGNQAWFQNGKLHRVDGPAAIYSNGRQEWWENGIKIR